MASFGEITTKGQTQVKRILHSVRRFKYSYKWALWVMFFLILASELYVATNLLFRNLIFQIDEQLAQDAGAVRINFENYNRVIERLDRVENYYATTSVDFIIKSPDYGRTNPFANPE